MNILPTDQNALIETSLHRLDLTTLTDLDVSFSNLSELPPLFHSLPCLQTVNLSHNSFSSLPPLNLPSLRHMNLRNNTIELLPDFSSPLLRTIDLSHNAIRHLPASFWSLKHLEHLDVSHNNLECLPDEFGSDRTIEYLNLSHNALILLPAWLNNLGHAKEINVADNPLYNEGCLQLTREFGRRSKRLRVLDFRDCGITAGLPEVICSARDMTTLYLGNEKPFSKKKDPADHHNKIGTIPGPLTGFVALTTLVVSNAGLSEIDSSIVEMKCLKHLDLSNNLITWLDKIIINLTTLEYLDLSHNDIDMLPFGLEKLFRLRELRLAGNSLSWISQDLPENAALRSLDLYGNRVDVDGLEGAKALYEQLDELDLGQNRIGERGIAELGICEYKEKQRRLRGRRGIAERVDPPVEVEVEREKRRNHEMVHLDYGLDSSESEEGDKCDNLSDGIDQPDWTVYPSGAGPPSPDWDEELETAAPVDPDDDWSPSGGGDAGGVTRYDFYDMGKYYRQADTFCPSDLHACNRKRREEEAVNVERLQAIVEKISACAAEADGEVFEDAD